MEKCKKKKNVNNLLANSLYGTSMPAIAINAKLTDRSDLGIRGKKGEGREAKRRQRREP